MHMNTAIGTILEAAHIAFPPVEAPPVKPRVSVELLDVIKFRRQVRQAIRGWHQSNHSRLHTMVYALMSRAPKDPNIFI
eukprot:3762307-Pyramimonas_sp.AAC.1